MKIGLVSERFENNNLEHNVQVMLKVLEQHARKRLDFLCFGEAFLQGFDCLSWKIEPDLQVGVPLEGATISRLQEAAAQAKVGLGFGFIEKSGTYLYSSYALIDKQGALIHHFRRVSVGWKEPIADPAYYREGAGITAFTYGGKRICVALCGDLWHSRWLKQTKALQPDLVLWPVYVNFTLKEWQKQRLAYAKRVQQLKVPVLMMNSLNELPMPAFGGTWVFQDGQILAETTLGEAAVLKFTLP